MTLRVGPPTGRTEQAIRDSGLRAYGGWGPSLAVAGSSVGLASVQEGQVVWARLSGAGEVGVGPVTVSAGVGGRDSGNPKTAWNGSLFAVVWSTNPGVYVAAVDGAGNVSPALRLDSGFWYAGVKGITSLDGMFVVSWTEDLKEAHFASLRCRSEADRGAPLQIAPLDVPLGTQR